METPNKIAVGSTGETPGAEKRSFANGTMNESQSEGTSGGLGAEYSEVNSNLRHYSSLRFAMFTVYFAVLGGLLSVAFGFFEMKSVNPEYAKVWVRISGFLVTSIFFVFELNCVRYLETYVDIAIELERKLQYKQIKERRERSHSGLLNPTYTPLGIYGGLILFWLAMMISWVFVILREESWWLDPPKVIALCFVLIVVLAFGYLCFQWRNQRLVSQSERCERILAELTRTAQEFQPAIDAPCTPESSLDPVEFRHRDRKIEDAAYNHYKKWDHLSSLVLEKRLSDPLIISRVERELLYAYKKQFRVYYPNWEKDARFFPDMKALFNECSKEERLYGNAPDKSTDATARAGKT